MKANWIETGKRIEKCRKELGYSQEKLGEELGNIIFETTRTNEPEYIKRQTVAGRERGTPVKKIEQIRAMCDIFDCDISYLLCECNTKRLQDTSVRRLGLTEKATDMLISDYMRGGKEEKDILFLISCLIENKKLLYSLFSAITADYTEGSFTSNKNGKTKKYYATAEILYTAELTRLGYDLKDFANDTRIKIGLDKVY